MSNEELYPVECNGKLYGREECDELFISMYEGSGIGEHCLNWSGGYYMGDGVYLYPDGSFGNEDGPESYESEYEDPEFVERTKRFIRTKLGQKLFPGDEGFIEPEHLRFDMSGNRDDDEGEIHNDKIWEIFKPYFFTDSSFDFCVRRSYRDDRPVDKDYCFIFHKGSGGLYELDPFESEITDRDESLIYDFSGYGTVDIIYTLFEFFNIPWVEIEEALDEL